MNTRSVVRLPPRVDRAGVEQPGAFWMLAVNRWTSRDGVLYACTRAAHHIEWIEYIPEPKLVERDGDLWWRYYDAELDTMVSVQLTKGTEDEDLPRIVPPRRVR